MKAGDIVTYRYRERKVLGISEPLVNSKGKYFELVFLELFDDEYDSSLLREETTKLFKDIGKGNLWNVQVVIEKCVKGFVNMEVEKYLTVVKRNLNKVLK